MQTELEQIGRKMLCNEYFGASLAYTIPKTTSLALLTYCLFSAEKAMCNSARQAL